MLITFEGIEGSGKSTQSKKLVRHLRCQGYKVIQTREPGGTPIGKSIRQMILDPGQILRHPSAELLLFTVDRLEHIEQLVKPALKEGKIVVCDRYIDSTYAYQHGGRGHALSEINQLVGMTDLVPDLTFLLDVPVETGIQRAKSRAALDRFEQEALPFHERVRQEYLRRASEAPNRFRVIKGDGRNKAAISEEIIAFFEEYERTKG